MTKSYKQAIENLKQEVRGMNLPKYENINKRNNKIVGTMYLKEKMDYGFHIYYIYEPSSSNKLAGVNGTVSEMYYDLRNRKYWIKRNMKEVQFSVRNVDGMFPSSYNEREVVFDFISTKSNRGLYEKALRQLGRIGEEKVEMYGRFFHRLITEYSYFELLFKAGVDFSKTTRIVNPNGNSPREILGLTKTQWKMISKYKLSPDTFNISYQDEFNTEKADKTLINMLAYMKTLEDEFGLEKIRSFVSNEFGFLYGTYHYRSALSVAEQYNLPVKILLKYLYFECDVSQGLNSGYAIGEYSDYIRMTTEMGYERFDRYPKFLRTAHDIVARNYKIQLNEIEMKEWNKSLEDLHKQYQYTYDGYKIFPPTEPSELVKEGNVLGHCVGSYVNKVRKGLSTILFLRTKDDVECPLVTIEVKNNRIIQARGKMNNPPTQEQKRIVKKFADKFELAM